MRKLLTSITFGICCVLSWVMAGMILEEEKTMLKHQEMVMEASGMEKLEDSSEKTLTPLMSKEKELGKEQL